MEDNLSLPELQQILDSSREQEKNRNRFMAAIQGIELDKNKQDGESPEFEAIKRRAEAKLRGVSEEVLELAEIGVAVIDEDMEGD